MCEYICICMHHCVKTEAKNVDEAKDKFIHYLKVNKLISSVDLGKLTIINYTYLGRI